MTNKRIKIGSALAVMLAVIVLVAAAFVAADLGIQVRAQESATVEYDFTDAEQLRDFTPVYAASESGGGIREEFSAHWTHNAEAGTVTSVRDASAGSDTELEQRISQLVLSAYEFENFQAEVTMCYASGSAWGWAGLQFRKTSLTSVSRKGGCFAFVQQEGHATLWGDDDFDNSAQESKNVSADAFKSTYKYLPFLLTVRVVGKSCDVTVSTTDKTTTYATLHYDFLKNESIKSGCISLTSVDDRHTFSNLRVTNLDAQGNPVPLAKPAAAPERVTISGAETTALSVGKSVALTATVAPQEANNGVIWTVSDPSLAVVKDGSVTAIGTGSVTVTAESVVDASVCDSVSFTVTAAEGGNYEYYFDTSEALAGLTASFVKDQNTLGGKVDASAYWSVEDGVLKRINFPSGTASDENVACLYANEFKAKNFEATVVYRNTTSDYGWIGITSGTFSYEQRFIDNGLGLFVQREGKPTAWGSKTDGPRESAADGYALNDWHVLKVRVYGDCAYLYIDDMYNAALSVAVPLTEGYVGLFTTCAAHFEIRSFCVGYLDEEGRYIDYAGVSKIEFANPVTAAKVGDSYTPQIKVTGESDSALEYEFTTSDGNVAFISNGIVRFISDGEVTIRVTCKFSPELYDEMTVTVAANHYTSPEESDNPPQDDGKEGEKGCASAASGEFGAVAALFAAFGAALLLVRKKRTKNDRR